MGTRVSAEEGGAAAQFRLGVHYATGRGVDRDVAEAVRWYRRAADQGCAKAQYTLGVMYRNGEAIEQDPIVAYMWFTLALFGATANQRSTWVYSRNRLGRSLTSDQLANAARRVRDWRLAHEWGAAHPLGRSLTIEPPTRQR